MKPISEMIRQKPWLGWVFFLVTMVIVFLLGLLASSIVERRAEAVFAYTPAVDIDSLEPDNARWGIYFPREYQSYLQTADTTFRSRYGGSATIDMLAESPELVVLWAGYSFSKDYNQGRGHYHAITDIRNTLRTGAPMGTVKSPAPNTCWTCKSSDVPRLIKDKGVAGFYAGTWETLGSEVTHPIGCIDCHNPATMNLHISRPALIEAFQRQGKDINNVSLQEMRSLVCAQCHVEYYFNKHVAEGVQYLTFPWDKGFSVDSIEAYYDGMDFSDWEHALSKAPMLKAQHPDYELYLNGIHAKRGISCADCHMPYISEGGQKFTSHHIGSPLSNVSSSCQVCHREETNKLIADVYERQDKIASIRHELEKLLVRAHVEAKAAWDAGARKEQMQEILTLIRHAQWRWDFAAASHGASFHAPLEVSRIISNGIEKAQEARIKLSRVLASLGKNAEIPMPDIASKEKAQTFIGLDMNTLRKDKAQFIKNVVTDWDNK